MNTKVPVPNAKAFICTAAMAVCAVLLGSVQAKSHEDTSLPAGARELYRRLQKAAGIVCVGGAPGGSQIEPASWRSGC